MFSRLSVRMGGIRRFGVSGRPSMGSTAALTFHRLHSDSTTTNTVTTPVSADRLAQQRAESLQQKRQEVINVLASDQMRDQLRSSDIEKGCKRLHAAIKDIGLMYPDDNKCQLYLGSMYSVLESKGQVDVDKLQQFLGPTKLDDQTKHLIQVVFKDTTKVFRRPVFMADADLNSIETRSVNKTNIKNTQLLSTKLTRQIEEELESGKSILVGGASGGGKTAAVLNLALEPEESGGQWEATALVYAVSSSLDMENVESNLLKMTDKTDRDKKVKDVLVQMVKSRVSSLDILKNMTLYDDLSLRLVIAVDEMGEYPTAVRGMCSLPGSTIREALGLPTKVQVSLIALGAGVGQGPKPPGTTSKSYESIISESDTNHLKIFYMYFAYDVSLDEEVSAVKKERCEAFRTNNEIRWDPHVKEVIEGNPRMAAILGSELRPIKHILRDIPEEKFFNAIDLVPSISTSSFKFKDLNALQGVNGFAATRAVMAGAVRMHFFPYAFEHNEFLVNRLGVVVDTAKWLDEGSYDSMDEVPNSVRRVSTGSAKPPIRYCSAYSRYDMPPFSTTVLAQLSGRSPVTESVVSGQALEKYWLSVSFLLGCAACSAELFTKLLKTYNNDNLKPLTDPLVNNYLARPLNSVVGELPGAGGKMSNEEYLKLFRNAVEPLTGKGKAGCCHVAAIGSPSMVSFADSILFIDESLFLFQMKDGKTMLSPETVNYERFRLGAVDDAALAGWINKKRISVKPITGATKLVNAAKDDSHKLFDIIANTSSTRGDNSSKHGAISEYRWRVDLVGSLAAAWHKATGMAVTKVQRVFVMQTAKEATQYKAPATQNAKTFHYNFSSDGTFQDVSSKRSSQHGMSLEEGQELFVAVEDIRFLKYRQKHPRSLLINEIND